MTAHNRKRTLALSVAYLCALLIFYTHSTAARQQPDIKLRSLLIEAINRSDSFEDRFDAEVWLVDMSHRLQHFVTDKKERLEMLRILHEEASRASLHPELVLAVIEIESRFDPYAVSRAGAQGLMQVMPFWLKEIGRPDDNLIKIQTNLRMGCTILKYYLDMENNDIRLALARYNGSVGSRRYSDKVLNALTKHWHKR